MLDLILTFVISVQFARLAYLDDRSGLVWAAAAAGCCILASAVIPLPLVGVIVGTLATFGLMSVTNGSSKSVRR